MKFSLSTKLMATKLIIACAITASTTSAFSHIVLENKSAVPGTAYKAVFLVGHGCAGAPTTAIAVQIPAAFQGAKPYPKAGWALAVVRSKLAAPYDSHGKQITEDVTSVTWTAIGNDSALQEAYADEFNVRGNLPEANGPLWFKVLQTCGSTSNLWADVPATGISTKGLKFPAALLEVVAPGVSAGQMPAGHKH